ncbi:MAG: M15 family metallopeptidase, partial [Chthoniobacteraceae bacterium]
KAGHSNHNFGIAFDIGVFKGGKYLPESPDYRKVGAIGAGIGLDWGGNWKSFEDQPHFELHPKWAASLSEEQMLKELRERKDSGKALFI